MKVRNFTVYVHINKANSKRYYGITKQEPRCRWSKGKGYKRNEYFHNAIQKYGWDNFEHIIITKGLTKEEAEFLEMELIREWDTTNRKKGYNIKPGGQHTTHSKESRKKISESRKGMSLSEEHKKNLSESLRGKTLSKKTREKISESLKGKPSSLKGRKRIPFSEEHKKKMSESHKGKTSPLRGKNLSEEHKKSISESMNKPVICDTTGVWFESAKSGAEYYNTSAGNITGCCKGRRKSAGKLNGEKLVWKYAD